MSPPSERIENSAIAEEIRACTKCECSKYTTQRVPGIGPKDAKIVAIARNPGATEDKVGAPLVGKAGDLFNKIVQWMGHSRDSIGILNVTGCFTPENRPPTEGEIISCFPFFQGQLDWFEQKKVVLAFGREAIQSQIGPVRRLKEVVNVLRKPAYETPTYGVIPMWHPSFLLRNDAEFDDFRKEGSLVVKEAVGKALSNGLPWSLDVQGELFS